MTWPRCATSTTATCSRPDFDAISSIGLTEHIGVRNYPSYFGFLRDHLRPEGRLLNHSITRHHNRREETGPFIDRYVFPDGELIGSGTIISEAQNAGLEVMHSENLRMHYAKTLHAWNDNLVANWDACVDEVGIGTARVWGLYMAVSRIGFEQQRASSCTRCSPSAPATTAPTDSRCARPGD